MAFNQDLGFEDANVKNIKEFDLKKSAKEDLFEIKQRRKN